MYNIISRILKISLGTCFVFLLFFTKAEAATVTTYSDVNINNKIYPSIEYLSHKKFAKGYEDGTFGFNKPINRAEALKLIIISTEKTIASGLSTFPDVPDDVWFAPFVSYAKEKGIVKGDPSGNFVPTRQVNRAEFIKMVLEAFEVNLAKYELTVSIPDVPEDAWFSDYVRFATQFNILELDESGKANPGEPLTRGESADLIYKTMKNGRGLDPQAILELTEKHLVYAMQILQNKEMVTAGLSVNVARNYVKSLNFMPGNFVVLAAKNATEAIQSLVGAYVAAENGIVEDVITASKKAWNTADEIPIEAAPTGLKDLAISIKKLAAGMAEKARTMKGTGQ